MKRRPVFKFAAIALLVSLLLVTGPGGIRAQTAPPASSPASSPAPSSPQIFEMRARAADAVTLAEGSRRIRLWGVEEAGGLPAAFVLRARTALDNAIGGKPAQCEVRARQSEDIYAQCVSAADTDLGLYMLQQGLVLVDRAAVYGTVFEEAYIQAELAAQDRSMGVWAEQETSGSASADGSWMLSLGFVLFLCIIAAFTAVSIVMMRGFTRVVDAQNDNVEMMAKERKLRDKERGVIAVMLDSEIKANKAKIEAYIVVYEEMLRALKDPDRPAKYKKSGDIVQKQPALDRSVFDRNTDKLDTLGDRLSSELIHFYARIKSKPEYINLEPDTELPEAIALLEAVLKNAQRLNTISDRLIDAFSKRGTMMDAPDEDGD